MNCVAWILLHLLITSTNGVWEYITPSSDVSSITCAGSPYDGCAINCTSTYCRGSDWDDNVITNCADNIPCVINCGGYSSGPCAYNTIYGNSASSLTLHAYEESSQYNFARCAIYAPSNAPMTIIAKEQNSLKQSSIYGDGGVVTINCDGSDGQNDVCSDVGLYMSDADEFNLNCYDSAGCDNIVLECPDNSNSHTSCNIYCEDTGTNCASMSITAADGTPQDVRFECDGHVSTCSGTITCSAGDSTCSGDAAMSCSGDCNIATHVPSHMTSDPYVLLVFLRFEAFLGRTVSSLLVCFEVFLNS